MLKAMFYRLPVFSLIVAGFALTAVSISPALGEEAREFILLDDYEWGAPLPHGNWQYQSVDDEYLHSPSEYKNMSWDSNVREWRTTGKHPQHTYYSNDGRGAGKVLGVRSHSACQRNVVLFRWQAPAGGSAKITFDGFLGDHWDRLNYGILDQEGESLREASHKPEGHGDREFKQTFSGVQVAEGDYLYMYAWCPDTRAHWYMAKEDGAQIGHGITVTLYPDDVSAEVEAESGGDIAGNKEISDALTAVPLVEGGEARATVVTAAEPAPIASYAAEELVKHVDEASGVTLPIKKEGDAIPDALARVYVGETRAARERGINVGRLGPDEFIMRTVGGNLFVLGREDPKADPLDTKVPWGGTLFGVYELLEQSVGVRWLWPGELGTFVPQQENIVVQKTDEQIEPALRFNRYRRKDVKAGKLGFSRETAQAYEDALKVYQRRHRRSDSRRPGSSHRFAGWWKKYGDEHPEWFAMNEAGERVGPTLCVSNSELHEYIVEEAWDGGGRLFLQETDHGQLCQCEDCLEWDGPQPDEVSSHVASDRYARFWKTVYEMAVKRNPDVKVLAYLYMNRLPAPTGGIELPENVIGQFVPWTPFDSYTWFPMDSKKLEWVKDQWRGWQETGITMSYRPNHTLAGYTMPHINMRQGGDFFRFVHEHGSLGADFDSLTGQWGVRGPEHYMYHRLFVKPHLTVEQVLDEYYAAFGPAAQEVAEYFNYWEDYNRELRESARWQSMWSRIGGAARQYPPEAFVPAEKILDEAMSAAESDENEDFTERVRFLQKGLEHARLAAHLMRAYGGGKEALPLDYHATPEKVETAREALNKLLEFRRKNEELYISDFSRIAVLEKKYYESLPALLDPETEIKDTVVEGDIRVISAPFGQWEFRKDPDNRGVEEEWYHRDAAEKSDWQQISVPTSWTDTHIGGYHGYAWYRVPLDLPPETVDKGVALLFQGIDEQAWVYVNGEMAGEHSVDSEGKPIGQLWDEAFTISVAPENINTDSANFLTVRVHASRGNAGIWRPVQVYMRK